MWSSGHDSGLTRTKLCDWTSLSLAAGTGASVPRPAGAGRGLAAVRPAYDGPTVLGLGVADGAQRPPSLASVAPSVLIPTVSRTLTSSTATTATPPSLSQSPTSSVDEAQAAASSPSVHPVSMASVPHFSACEVGGALGAKSGFTATTVGAVGLCEAGPVIEQSFVCSGGQALPRWLDRLPVKGVSKVESWLQDSTGCSKFGATLANSPSTLSTCLHVDGRAAPPVQAWLNAGRAELEGTSAMLRGEGTLRRA